jgi:hypothetical protein
MAEGDVKQFKIVTPFPTPIKPDSVRCMWVQCKADSIGFLYVRIRLVTNCINEDSAKVFELQAVSRPVARATFAPKELFRKDTADVGGAGVVRSVTVTNTGSTALNITDVMFTGPDSVNYGVKALTTPIQPGKSGTVDIMFTPKAGFQAASQGTAVVHSNNAGGGADAITLYGFGCLRDAQVTPESLFVGQVVDTTAGQSQTEQVTLTNPGNCPVVITSVAVTGADANLYRILPPVPTSLGAGATAQVTVQFTPNRVTPQTPIASLEVHSSSPVSPVLTLPLLAKGGFYRALMVPDSSKDLFATVTAGIDHDSSVQCITIQNTGMIALQISGATLGGLDAAEYCCATWPSKAIPPGGIDQVCVTFAPHTTGLKSATLRISTNSSLNDFVYRLRGTGVPTSGVGAEALTITAFQLFQNYPNPFNPTTRIAYDVARHAPVRLEVLNALGERVALLANAVMDAGRYVAEFDATSLPSGTYFYRLTAEGYTETRVMNLMK